jgi:polyhydroxybutyrate depolymerase
MRLHLTVVTAAMTFAGLALGGCHARLPTGQVPSGGLYRVVTDIKVRAAARSYALYVPEGYDHREPVPLLVLLHGAYGSGDAIVERSGFDRVADDEGFLILAPDGIGIGDTFRHFNAGFCCAWSMAHDIDDVAFVQSTIDDVTGRFAIDPDRIYVVGHSNGGMLAHAYAAEHSGDIAAMADIAGCAGGRESPDVEFRHIDDPARAVPVMMVHGRDDETVPYGGGRSSHGELEMWSVAQGVALWAENNGCAEEPDEERSRGDRVLRQTYGDCQRGADVVLVTIEGWGHDLPGRPQTDALPASDELQGYDVAAEIWAFLERFRR